MDKDVIAWLNKKLRPDEQLWDDLEEGKSVEEFEEEIRQQREAAIKKFYKDEDGHPS